MGFVRKTKPQPEEAKEQGGITRGFTRKSKPVSAATAQAVKSSKRTVSRIGFTRKTASTVQVSTPNGSRSGFTRKIKELPRALALYLRGYKRVEGRWQLKRRCQFMNNRRQCINDVGSGTFTCREHRELEPAFWRQFGSPSYHWEPDWVKKARKKAEARGEEFKPPREENQNTQRSWLKGAELALFRRRGEKKRQKLLAGLRAEKTPVRFTGGTSGFRRPLSTEKVNEALGPLYTLYTDRWFLKKKLFELRKRASKLERQLKSRHRHRFSEDELVSLQQELTLLNTQDAKLDDEYYTLLDKLSVEASVSFEMPKPEDLPRRNFMTEQKPEPGTDTDKANTTGKKYGNRGKGGKNKNRSRGHRKSCYHSIKTKTDEVRDNQLKDLFLECQQKEREQVAQGKKPVKLVTVQTNGREERHSTEPKPQPQGFTRKTAPRKPEEASVQLQETKTTISGGFTRITKQEPQDQPQEGGFTRKTRPRPTEAKKTVEIPV